MFEDKISIEEIILERDSSTSLKNLGELIGACNNANILVLIFSYSNISIINSMLRSEGVYSELLMRNEHFESIKSNLESEKRFLHDYVDARNQNKTILLSGSSRSLRTWLLTQCLSKKIASLDLLGLGINVIVALNVPSEDSKPFRNIQTNYLSFINNINALRSDDNNIQVQFKTLSMLIREYGAFPNEAKIKELIRLMPVEQRMDTLDTLLTKDLWIPGGSKAKSIVLETCQLSDQLMDETETTLLARLYEQSIFEGEGEDEIIRFDYKQRHIWLEKEISEEITNSKQDVVAVLRQKRQKYLFDAFLQWYWNTNKSSFILETLIPRMTDIKNKEKNCHTLILIDGLKKMIEESQWTTNIKSHDSFDLFIGVESETDQKSNIITTKKQEERKSTMHNKSIDQ